MIAYSAFGLALEANRPLPGLPERESGGAADTRIWLGLPAPLPPPDRGPLWYVSDESGGSAPVLRVWRSADGAYFTMQYSDETTFVLNRRATDVWASWPDSLTLEDTATYLLGPVLGFVLRLRGCTCLHASAVAVGDGAIALMGPAGAGKSTTAAAFGMQGYALVTEDVLALTPTPRGFDVRPGYPQVRLWPDSVRLLYGDAEALPQLTPTWDKRALAFAQPGLRFRRHPLPLKAVYVLSEAVEPQTEFVLLKGADSVLALLANTYVGYLLDTQQRRDEFAVLTRLAACAPVRRAALAHGATPDDVCTHLLHDLETLERCTA